MEHFTTLLNLSQTEAIILVIIVFFAGMVRGFSGFALSALVMASAVIILPPVELIPICWCLEIAASVLMVKNGWKEADRPTAFGLVIGSAIGTPVGIVLTLAVSVSVSKTIALIVIITLALCQLFKVNSPFLATKPGLYISGFIAGVVTGLASVGGMVVALYVMARNAPAKTMRATLVMFLFISSTISLITLLVSGVMDSQSFVRGLIFAPPTIAGVFFGKLLFRPNLEKYYRPFCLLLLVGLSTASLAKIAW
ncbi:hypothetical protein RB2150_15431 [Rhodobacteraceae bacterium HTCC2150]|nr:hypothetical protein RB2150_15431 [Rhodobacteraceae bacterium HTCC2150]